MPFTLDRFLRNVSLPLLREYAEAKAASLLAVFPEREAELPKKGKRKRMQVRVDEIRKAIDGLPDDARATVLDDFEQIEQLGNDPGHQAIRASLVDDGAGLIDKLAKLDSHLDRALRTFLDDQPAFRRAEDILFHNRAVNSDRLWSGFRGRPDREVPKAGERMDAFRAELSQLFRETDGSGRHLAVDVFERGPRKRSSAGEGKRLVQVTVHVEALPTTSTEFNGAALKRRVYRPAVEVAVTYAPESGEIEVVAKGAKAIREGIARVFNRHLLHAPGDIDFVPVRTFDLSALGSDRRLDYDARDGIVGARVVRLKLAAGFANEGFVTLELGRARKDRSVLAVARSWLGSEPSVLAFPHPKRATIEITLAPRRGSLRNRKLRFDLAEPHGCTLKERTDDERLIGEKYLARWGFLRSV